MMITEFLCVPVQCGRPGDKAPAAPGAFEALLPPAPQAPDVAERVPDLPPEESCAAAEDILPEASPIELPCLAAPPEPPPPAALSTAAALIIAEADALPDPDATPFALQIDIAVPRAPTNSVAPPPAPVCISEGPVPTAPQEAAVPPTANAAAPQVVADPEGKEPQCDAPDRAAEPALAPQSGPGDLQPAQPPTPISTPTTAPTTEPQAMPVAAAPPLPPAQEGASDAAPMLASLQKPRPAAPQPLVEGLRPATFIPETVTVESLPAPMTPEAPRSFEPAPLPAPALAAPATATAERRAAPRSPLVSNVLERLEILDAAPGRTRVLLRPQGLGILEIDVVSRSNGTLQIALRAENPLVLQALQSDAGALSDYLGARGFDMGGGSPDLSRYTRPEPEAPAAHSASEEPDAESVAPDQILPGQAGQLNIVT